jgi:hypothetical protein
MEFAMPHAKPYCKAVVIKMVYLLTSKQNTRKQINTLEDLFYENVAYFFSAGTIVK